MPEMDQTTRTVADHARAAQPTTVSPQVNATATQLLALQRSVGNSATAALVRRHLAADPPPGPASEALIRRSLDPSYQPAALKKDGYKPGWKLLGATSFAKLLDSLKEYFAAKRDPEQYAALVKIQAQISSYESSSARTKSRTGSSKQKEDDKQDLVRKLAVDVQDEIDSLNASPSIDLLNAHSDASVERVVLVVARNLAKELNIAKLDDLAKLSPDALQNKFISEVYLPQYMDERSGKKAPGSMSIAEQVDQIRSVNRIDASKLQKGTLAFQLFDLLERANIGKGVRALADPKFGGTEVEDFVPDLPGWDETKALAIKGGGAYRDKVKALVADIARTPVGAALLKGIGGPSSAEAKGTTVVHPQAKTQIAKINPPSLANVNYKDARSGQYMYANSAGKGAATVDAYNDVIGADPDKTKDEPFRKRDAAVGLFHELVHVYVGAVDEAPFVSLEDPAETMACGLMYEPRVAGIRVQEKRGGKLCTFPFDDPRYNPISENTFRKQYAKLKGQAEYHARPYYNARDTTEVKGPTDALPTDDEPAKKPTAKKPVPAKPPTKPKRPPSKPGGGPPSGDHED